MGLYVAGYIARGIHIPSTKHHHVARPWTRGSLRNFYFSGKLVFSRNFYFPRSLIFSSGFYIVSAVGNFNFIIFIKPRPHIFCTNLNKLGRVSNLVVSIIDNDIARKPVR